MTTSTESRIQAYGDIGTRYARVFKAAWRARASLTPKQRTPLERQFLPAALEIIETSALAPALPRAIIATIVAAFLPARRAKHGCCSQRQRYCRGADVRTYASSPPTCS